MAFVNSMVERAAKGSSGKVAGNPLLPHIESHDTPIGISRSITLHMFLYTLYVSPLVMYLLYHILL